MPERKLKARLMGYNTLESYGAVHRFGPGEKRLFEIAGEATTLARSQAWTCTSYNTEGGYGRKNVDCPDLRRALLEAGLAHVFSVSGPADEADLKAQAIGIKAAAGMWSEGPPSSLVTSIHSLDEKPGARAPTTGSWTLRRGRPASGHTATPMRFVNGSASMIRACSMFPTSSATGRDGRNV